MSLQDEIDKINREAEATIKLVQEEAKRKTERAFQRDQQREEMRRKNEEARRQAEELKARLERENGVVNHPKRDLLWAKAWEHGHSAGLSEVEIWYDDLVELLK